MLRSNYKKICAFFILTSTLATTQASCAGAVNHDHHHGMEHSEAAESYGHPGDPAKADRTIEITAVDIAFVPEAVTVKRGETVKFVVTNTGKLLHELVLGTKEDQAEHNAQMSGLSPEEMAQHMQSEGNGIVVQPSQTREITWTFSTDLEQVQFACHVPGHYEAGMSGLAEIADEL